MRLRIFVSESKSWRWLEGFALATAGIAILWTATGIVLTRTRHPLSRRAPASEAAAAPAQHEAPGPVVAPPEPAAKAPEQGTESVMATPKEVPSVPVPARARAAHRAEPDDSSRGIRLRGKGSMVIVAVAEADSEELRRHPDRLPDLIRSGALFSVPTNTVVEVAETHDGFRRVHVLEGAFQGRDGWVRADQVTQK